MTYHNAVKYLLLAPEALGEVQFGTRLRRLWQLLGNPQNSLNFLRLAGSSGKTVCAQMLLSAFATSDFCVGCLIMPLGNDPRENIRIGKQALPFDEMAHYVEQIYSAVKTANKELHVTADEQTPSTDVEPLSPTRHEILLSAALLAFQAHHCHLCIIESNHLTNDPTKILPAPLATAVCGTIPKRNGKDMQQIRSYISHGIQEVVSAPQDQEAYQMLSRACAAINCRLTIPMRTELQILRSTLSGSDFLYRNQPYHLGLCGNFQITNAMVTLEILHMLSRHGYALTEEQIAHGLRSVKIPCKFEVLSVSPTIIADSTHSKDAIETVCHSLTDFRPILGNKLWLCLSDQDLAMHYLQTTKEQGYEIEKIILQSNTDASADPMIITHTVKDTVRYCLTDLPSDTILLISGTQNFTSQIRYELLKKLGF